MKPIISAIAGLGLAVLISATPASGKDKEYILNRSPLVPKPYTELPLGNIKPAGWLEDQLVRMKDGMTGHLDTMYPEVMGDRNAWLGGDGDAWERGPYWIDGLLPLAYILEDDELIAKSLRWVENAIASQQPDGYFGPSTDRKNEPGLQRGNSHDWWPKMVMLKVMQQYYSATGDERVISFLTRYFKYQLETLPEKPLDYWTWWGKQRGGDNLAVVYWLYNITGDDYLLELGDLIHSQVLDWTGIFEKGDTLSQVFSMHCVNLAQGIKEPVIQYQRTGDPGQIAAVKKGFTDIRRYIGWPNGLYGGDEWLHGNNPNQGSELCSAVEMMYSLEKMMEITGDVGFADHLERICFNALPTQINDDFTARQYFQQCNQVELSDKPRNFITHYQGTPQLMGLLTGYPCCTANLHQGWPKFTRHLWMAAEDGGLAALVYSPCRVTAKVSGGCEIEIKEDTFYPFEEQIRFNIEFKKGKKAVFPLHLRIPSWCGKASVRVNGEILAEYDGGQVIKIEKEWRSGDNVVLELPMSVTCSRWYENSAVIERGPLVYALKIGERWEKVTDAKHDRPHWNEFYEVYPTTAWNYGFPAANIAPARIEDCFKVVKKPLDNSYPWNLENAPIEIHTQGRRLPDWHMYNGDAGPLPFSSQPREKAGEPEDIVLIPYGCTTLRITEFPLIK